MSMVTFDVENGSIIYRTMIRRKDDQTKGKRNTTKAHKMFFPTFRPILNSEDNNTNYVNQMKNKNTTKLDYNENHFPKRIKCSEDKSLLYIINNNNNKRKQQSTNSTITMKKIKLNPIQSTINNDLEVQAITLQKSSKLIP